MNALHRTTFQYVYRINPAYFPVAQWIYDPDLSAVIGLPQKYWVVTGDVVSAMTQPQRDAVDAAQVATARDAQANAVEAPNSYNRALVEVLLAEINTLRAAVDPPLAARTLTQVRNAIRSRLDG